MSDQPKKIPKTYSKLIVFIKENIKLFMWFIKIQMWDSHVYVMISHDSTLRNNV